MDKCQEDKKLVGLAHGALQANKDHLHALKAHTENLEAELETLDKLLETVDSVDECDLDVGSFVAIHGSVRATTPIAAKELLSPDSPFYEDALKRSRYQSFTEIHPMKVKELEALAEAVKAESYRKHALDMQKRGSLEFPVMSAQIAPDLGLDSEGIDWDRIAERVSGISATPRTAKECEIRWLGDQHPQFNREPWSQEEVLRVKSLAAEVSEDSPDWVSIADRLGTRRTPLDCMRHATSRKSHQWTPEADERLLKAIRMYGHENWHLVARYVSEDATPSQCSTRFQRTLDESIRHTSWTPEEDVRLSAAVAAYGSSWVDVAANVPGRHNDQCRDRWNEQLNPSINRSQWSDEEDKLLLACVRDNTDVSWKEISERLRNGRTENMCRGRYIVLQKDTNTDLATPSEAQGTPINQRARSSSFVSTSSNTIRFKPAFPAAHPCSTSPAPVHSEDRSSNQIVFLEPLVSANPESHKRRKPHPKARPKTTATGDIPPSQSMAMPPSKRRKTQSQAKRSNKPSLGAQQEGSTT
ncbi:Homeodomain-like protein [Chiua virens]|nr:Homeodomain-like protein [Chiua virens]